MGEGKDVWGDFINEVLHQGSVYGATASAVSWVISFLDRGGLPGAAPVGKAVRRNEALSQKAWAFTFLSLAAGSATSMARATPELASGVLRALRKGTSLFEKGLSDSEVEVRLASAAIRKAIATSADRTLAFESITERYELETESGVSVTMLSALNALAETGDQWNARLSAHLKSAASDREKFYAAAYLIQRLGRSSPEGPANWLAQFYANLPEAGYEAEVGNLEDPDDLLWAAIRATKASHGVGGQARTLKLCRENGGFKTIRIVEWLLRLASNDKRSGWGSTAYSRGPKIEYYGVAPSRARAWLRSPAGKAALKAIVNKTEVWRIETNLFSLFGLPSERKKLRELSRTSMVD